MSNSEITPNGEAAGLEPQTTAEKLAAKRIEMISKMVILSVVFFGIGIIFAIAGVVVKSAMAILIAIALMVSSALSAGESARRILTK